MRIGVYDPYLDSLGGGERYMLTIASCLANENEVVVFWHDKEILQKAQKKLDIDLSKVKVTTNIFDPKRSAVKKLIESSHYDCIFFLSDGSIPVTLARKTILHFQFPVEWVNGQTLLNKIKLNKVTDVICNSKFTKKYIDKKFNIESTVIYPPCGNTEKPNEYTDNKQNLVITVGRYNPLSEGKSFKKHEVLIETWKKLIDNGLKNWKFIIATSYLDEHKKQVDELEKQIEKYPIEIVRHASFTEITQLYQKAKIYWHASGFGENIDQHPERTEHFGITVVEAMQYGVIPIVFNAGGTPEIIDQSIDGYLWNTTEELIEYTNKLMSHDTMRLGMTKEAVEKAKKFSTNKFCKKLKDFIL